MLGKSLRFLFVLLLFLGACSSSTTAETADVDESVEEVVDEESDDELVEEEAPEDDAPEEDVPVEEATETATEEEVVDEEPSDEEVAEDETAEDEAVEEVVPAASGEVVLLDAGAEPRQELRYTLTEGTEILSIAQSSSQSQSVDGELFAGGGPPIGTVVDSLVTRTLDGDLFVLESEITSAAAAEGTDPTTTALLEDAFAPSLGLTTISTVDDRGVVVEAESGKTGDPTVDELVASLEGATNPFPTEAVGIGATWQVEIEQNALGLNVTNRATSVLREFTDGGVIIDVTIEQISNDLGNEVDLGGGIFVTVESWDISGSGFVEVAFDQVSPIRAENIVEGVQVFSAPGEGTLEQSISFETVITGG